MKANRLLFYLCLAVIFSLNLSEITAQTLTHSYVFENDVVEDVVGGANGTIVGDVTAADGVLTMAGGYVTLPAKDINIASYESITIEAVYNQIADLTTTNILFSFGTVDDSNWGNDYLLYYTCHVSGGDSGLGIANASYSSPWSNQQTISGEEIVDTFTHYTAVTITATEMYYYLDGSLVGSVTLENGNGLSALSTDTAFIGLSVYVTDPEWLGTISEFKIYDAAMTEEQIAARAEEVYGSSLSDATLKSITYDVGEMDRSFDPSVDTYELTVPYGVTSVDFDFIATVPQATVLVYDYNTGDEYSADEPISFTSDGIDLEIVVLAMDGQTESYYYISIFFNDESASAELSDITMSTGYLLSDFDSKTTEYSAMVPYGTETVEVTGVPGYSEATVSGGGTITLVDGSAEVELVVTSQDQQNTKTYTVSITESVLGLGYEYYIQQEASELVIGENASSGISLYNPLLNEGSQLFHIEESAVDGQFFLQNQDGHYLALSPSNSWSLLMTETLTQDQDSSSFILDEFEPGRFRILSVARQNLGNSNVYVASDAITAGSGIYVDKSSTNDYGIWSFKFPNDVVDPYDTYLDTLSVSAGALSPSFDAFTYDYYVVVPQGVDAMTISATAIDGTATVAGAGNVTLDGESGTFTVTVTATDPSYSHEYYIHYKKDVALTLKHAYTFADGTANDAVSDADGTLMGGTIVDGAYLAAESGDYIELPGETIALNTYPTFTMEAYFTNGVNDGYAMLAYFGGLSGSNAAWMQPSRGDDMSRVQILTNSTTVNVSGAEIPSDYTSHMVFTVGIEDIRMYLDGMLIDTMALSPNTIISDLSTDNAWIGKSGWSDPSWLGTLYEFNIYAGVMDAQTVADHAIAYPTEDSTSVATLSSVTIADTTYTAFESTTTAYTFILPEGTTEVPEITGVATNSNATVVVEKAESIPGVTTITVTSEDKEQTVVYTFEFAGVTAVATPEVAQVKVYPTVTSGSFTIESESASQRVSVYDLSGSLVMQQSTSSSRQEISLEKAGMYILMVEADNARSIFKVIKTN